MIWERKISYDLFHFQLKQQQASGIILIKQLVAQINMSSEKSSIKEEVTGWGKAAAEEASGWAKAAGEVLGSFFSSSSSKQEPEKTEMNCTCTPKDKK